jgi:hypothetical protein
MYIDISENAIYMYIIYEQLDDMINDRGVDPPQVVDAIPPSFPPLIYLSLSGHFPA